MDKEQEFEVKALEIKDSNKFEDFAEELLSNWKEYKRLDARMKLLDVSCKKYMIDKNLDNYSNEYGKLFIIKQNRRVLDRALIKDIEKYKVDSVVNMMYKSQN